MPSGPSVLSAQHIPTVVVLSLNTAVDRTYLVPRFEPGRVFRAEHVRVEPGGKGINVARVLRGLDVPHRLIGFLGGPAATTIREGCEELDIEAHWVPTAGETRTCTIVVDGAAPQATVINVPGPTISGPETGLMVSKIDRWTSPGDILCISGSMPPGMVLGFYAQVIRAMREKDVRVLVDAAGPLLRKTLHARPWAAAPNYEETVAAFPGEIASPRQAAHRLAQTCGIALLTRGADGVLYDDGRDMLSIVPPRVETVNPVGSGDAFVAGFLAGIAEGRTPVDAVKLGVACGASNAGRLVQGIDPREELTELETQVVVEPV